MAADALFHMLRAGTVRALAPLLLGALLAGAASLTMAAELLPLLDPLPYKQRTSQMLAAPSGTDQPLEESPVTLVKPEALAAQEPPSQIEQKVAEQLEPITLEEKIQQQVIRQTLDQFGYDLFSELPATFVPVSSIPVPPDYIVGPGDTLVVQLYGKTNLEYNLVVTREGQLLVPEIGPIQVSGLTFLELKESLTSRLENQIFGVNAAITLGELRTIRVLVLGDVVRPGSYTVPSLTSLFNALLTSGGVKRTGSLRRIQLKRDGQLLAEMDLYRMLLQGDTSGDHRLAHGDVIFVPPLGDTVGIAGEVQRPAIYELRDEATLGALIDLAGGLLPTASLPNSHIERIVAGRHQTLVDFKRSGDPRRVELASGDLVRVFPVQSSIENVVLLSGHVVRPGGYQWQPGLRVSDLLPGPQAVRSQADMQVAVLRRENRPRRLVEARYVDLQAVLRQPRSRGDIALQPRDELIVLELAGKRAERLAGLVRELEVQARPDYPAMLFSVQGHVRYPGTLPLQRGARLLDVLGLAGGVASGTDLSYAVLARRQDPSDLLQVFSLDLTRAAQRPDSEWNPLIHPRDRLFVFGEEEQRSELLGATIDQLIRQTPSGQVAPVVSVDGSVRHQGRYPLDPGMRLSDLIRAAGGLQESGYRSYAELTRYELIDGEFRLASHRQVELARVLSGDPAADPVLQGYDHLVVHRKPLWDEQRFVTLKGEVLYPGRYPVAHHETLCQLIERAGGLTTEAYPFGALFLRDSVREKQQKALDRVQGNLDDLLVNLHLSPTMNNSEKMPAGEQKHQIAKVIRQLQETKALGRMVIDLERIMSCDEQRDLLLEDGDLLLVPKLAYEVSVMGEVYMPTTHAYDGDLGSQDYIDLSGGTTVLARAGHAYVVQANGQVYSVRSGDWLESPDNIQVRPGATIFVPIDVDRANSREVAQSWSQIIYHLAVSAASAGIMIGL